MLRCVVAGVGLMFGVSVAAAGEVHEPGSGAPPRQVMFAQADQCPEATADVAFEIVDQVPACVFDSCVYAICFVSAYAGYVSGGSDYPLERAHAQCSGNGNPCGW